jgi:hypothetical protein
LFGVLGTALIWRGISRSHYLYLMAGFLVTSFGMIARAGAFFVLPLLVLWGAILHKQKGKIISWQFFVGGLIAIGLPFFANQLLVQSFGTSNIVPFGNFSYSLYGLASGGNSWAYVVRVYPNAGYLEIYEMAIRLILEQPNLLVKGIVHNYSIFFSNTIYGLFSYMKGEGNTSSTISYWLLLLLSFLSVWDWFHHRDDLYLGFVMVSAIGLFLSVPFLPPTDAFRLRAYATSIVVLALLPSMGLHYLLSRLRLDGKNGKGAGDLYQHSLAWFSSIVALVVLLGPFMARGTDLAPKLDPPRCKADLTSVVVRYDLGSMVHIVPQNAPLLDWAPTYHIGTLRRSVHGFPNFSFMAWALESVVPQHTLFYAFDYRSIRNVLAVVRSDLLPTPPALLELCGEWEKNPDIAQFGIFYASFVYPINPE